MESVGSVVGPISTTTAVPLLENRVFFIFSFFYVFFMFLTTPLTLLFGCYFSYPFSVSVRTRVSALRFCFGFDLIDMVLIDTVKCAVIIVDYK